MTTGKEENDANGELPTVIHPGKAPDLQAMVRDALRKNGIDPTTGSAPQIPLQQPRTMPMPQRPAQVPGVRVQSTPKAPNASVAPSSARAPASARSAQATPAATARPTTTPDAKKRSSFGALLTIGIFALAAAGGAVWVARNKAQLPLAAAAPQTAAAPQPTTTESAVGFVVAPRPGENGEPKAEAKPAETTPPAAAAPPPPPPATFESSPGPAPKNAAKEAKEPPPPPTHAAATPATHTAKQPIIAAKPPEEPKPKPAAPPATQESKPKPPETKTAAADTKPATPPPAPPPAPGGSVDAILQQQLKSAIP